ncbi:MAG: hypothetical protein ACKO45_14165 [Cyanobium sp.]
MVSSSTPRSVSGKVAWPDGSPQVLGAYSVQAFDAAAASTAPQPLGKPVALAADGRYRIPYRWTSTAGRNGPTLLVQVVDPSGQVLGEARRTTTAVQATLNITLKPPAAPPTFTVRGTVRLSTGEPSRAPRCTSWTGIGAATISSYPPAPLPMAPTRAASALSSSAPPEPKCKAPI